MQAIGLRAYRTAAPTHTPARRPSIGFQSAVRRGSNYDFGRGSRAYSGWNRAIVFPSGSLNHADFPMPRLVPIESTVLKRREVVLLEDDTSLLQFLDVGGDVARPEPHLRMVGLVRVAAPVDEESGAIPTLEHEVVLDRFRGEPQPDLLLVELLAPNEIGRAENRRDPVVCYHAAHLQGLRRGHCCVRVIPGMPTYRLWQLLPARATNRPYGTGSVRFDVGLVPLLARKSVDSPHSCNRAARSLAHVAVGADDSIVDTGRLGVQAVRAQRLTAAASPTTEGKTWDGISAIGGRGDVDGRH